MGPPRFEIASARAGPVTAVLSVVGDLDMATSPQLMAKASELIDAGTRALVVDLSDCTFLETSGLHALVVVKERLARERGHLTLCGVSPRLLRVFSVSRLENVLPLHPSQDEAIREAEDSVAPAASA